MAQEREFYKYCQLPQRPGHLHRPPLSPRSEAKHELLPESSNDTTLTALAQLGALRLNAQRCMISLFDRRTQYILAEATRTLSLQDDRVHVDGDALWLGSSVIPRDEGLCHAVLDESRLNVGTEPDNSNDRYCALVIPDLTKDERFNKRHYVVNAPRLRFFAGVPIRSRRGIAIGSFTVSDGLTRETGLSALEIRFLTDTATAIMNHLEMVRSHDQNRRGAKMIAGLGNFVEGGIFPSSSLRRRRDCSNDHVDHVDQEGELSEKTTADEKPRNPPLLSRRMQRPASRLSLKERIQQQAKSPMTSGRTTDRSMSDSNSPNRKRDAEVTLTSGTREIFGRAARVLRESLEVEGVVFFDASVKSYAGLVRNSDDRPSDASSGSESSENPSSSDCEDPATGQSSTETDDSSMSDVLSYALQDPEQPMGAIRETFLRSLLRNYPQGAIFNIDENGGISSSEGSDSASGTTVSREIAYRKHEGGKVQRQWKQRKRQRVGLKEENKGLLKVFPSARCITLFPLWDSRRNRWFSGLFLWTKSPRSFSLGSQLAYLYAFSNSIMADVHRLDMELANRAHATLVGSISHELRSPLHGILGSTELLGDNALSPAQTGLVNTIEYCGRSLLDIINNMLDFAKINQFTRKSRSSRLKLPARAQRRMKRDPRSGTGQADAGYGVVNLISDVQLEAVLEEVADSVFAGHCFSSKSGPLVRSVSSMPTLDQEGEVIIASPTERPLSAFNEALTVVYEVAPDAQWLFETQAGAWRRILMNLFGNALKYTQSGYISVSLKSSTRKMIPRTRSDSDREEMTSVTLTVKDTGRGIDTEYLQSNVFKPFSQEDPLSPGSGLGLSIVHQTVLSLGGKIDISSTKGVGTEVTVKVDLPRTPNAEIASDDEGPVIQTQKLLAGKSIGLVGFGTSDQDDKSLAVLRSSLSRMYQEHFGLNVGFVSQNASDSYDIYVVRQAHLDGLEKITSQIPESRKDSSPVLVVCSTPQMAQKLSSRTSKCEPSGVFEFVSQPCGPCKMAHALRACIDRQEQKRSQPPLTGDSTNGTTLTPEEETQTLRTDVPPTPLGNTSTQAEVELSPTKSMATITTSTLDVAVVKQAPASPEDTQIVPTVLLVDDNTVNLQLLVAVMKKAKFAYITASNGLEALDLYKAHANEIRVILMDISMPVMDGLESTREIRSFEKEKEKDQHDSFKPATVIALSGLGSSSVRQEAFNSGMDLFLSKPVRFQELIKQIDELVR
ncbi:hypothetical protein BJX99DRAFT_262373 [Aspergillus californicus]